MITNERQYKITRSQAEKFREALQKFNEIDLIKQGIDPVIASANRTSLNEQLNELEGDLIRYEELRSGKVKEFFTTNILEIGDKLIEARIARGLSQQDLAELLGMKEQQVQRYEQERYLTANLTRLAAIVSTLQLKLQASVNVSSQEKISHNVNFVEADSDFDPKKLPIKEMKKRGWLHNFLPLNGPSPKSDFELAAAFISQAHAGLQIPALHRQHVRTGGKIDKYSLLAWKAQVLHKAKRLLKNAGKLAPLDSIFIKHLVELSQNVDGPIRAVEILREKGVLVVFEKHLSGTHLDGAAMLLNDTTPVIGITLRQDRFDNFWFVLMHEIAHIIRHREKGLRHGFFDYIIEDSVNSSDQIEKEADEYAQNVLISDEVWKSSFVRFTKTREQVIQFAKKHKISPSIVGGRIRRERGDYSVFTDLVGQGEVRKLFATAGLLEN